MQALSNSETNAPENGEVAIAEKQSELNKILIDEIKAEASNPLGG